MMKILKKEDKVLWATACGIPILIDKDIVDELGIKEPKPQMMPKGTTQYLYFGKARK